MARLTCCIALIVFLAAPVLAEQYWIAYEGNDFPEREGWERRIGYGGAKRWIEDSTLVIDGRESINIYDFYVREMNGRLDPDPGETFVLQWRIKVDEVIGWADPGVSVQSDDAWGALFVFDVQTIYSAYEPGKEAPLVPGVFHSFVLHSADMRQYSLWIDGVPRLAGAFRKGVTASRVAWGDAGDGAASMSRWDYLRFGVVPEPNSGTTCLAVLLPWIRRWSRGDVYNGHWA